MPDELDNLLQTVAPARTATRLRRPAAPPAMETFQPDGAAWSIKRAPEVEDYFRQTFKRELPVTAFGESATHNRMGLDHSNSMDVGLHPDSAEGQALTGYLRENNIPFLAFRRAVPGAATAAHIHVGYPSHGLSAGGGDALDQVLAGVPQPDPLDKVLADVPTAKPASPGVNIVRSGSGQAGAGEFWWVDAQGNKTRRVVSGDELPDDALAMTEPDERVTANAQRPGGPQFSSPRQLRPRFDPQTVEGRVTRDAQQTAQAQPDARLALDLTLPKGVGGWDEVTSNQLARTAAQQYARAHGIPDEFVSQWLAKNGHELKAYDLKTGAPVDGIDAIGRAGVYDSARRTVRVSAEMPHLLKLKQDYEAWRSPAAAAVDWATDPDRSAGEKFLDVTTPPARAALKALDYGTRPLKAIDNLVWSGLRGSDSLQPVADAFMGREPNAQEQNPISTLVGESEALRRINPNLPGMAAGLTEAVTSPSNALLPLGGEALRAARGSELATRAGEAVNAIGEVGRGERFARAGRVLDARRLATTEAGQVGAFVRDADGSLHLQPKADTVRRVYDPTHAADFVDDAGARYQGTPYALSKSEAASLRAAGEDPAEWSHVARKGVRGELVHDKAIDWAAGEARLPHPPAEPPHHANFQPRATSGEFIPGKPRSTASHLLNGTLDVLSAPRSLLTTADLSAPGRQGLIFSLTEPRAALKAMGRQVRSFVSQKSHDDLMRWLATHPDADLAEQSGLYSAMKQQAGLSGREEAFMSRIAGRLPVVKQSERAYVAYLDSLRQDVFSKYARELRRAGYNAIDHPNEFKSIARFINSATGRGELPQAIEKLAPALNATLFAPRNLKGKFDVLNPIFYAQMSPAARRIAARKMLQFTGTVTAGMYLAYLAGAKVTLDPDDPDFGKVVVGRTHYDFTGGLRTPIRVVARLGKTFAAARGGELKSVARQAGGILWQFARQNAAPVPGYAVAAATGTEVNGEKFERLGHLRRNGRVDPGGGALARVLPLSVQDIFEAWAEEGSKGVAKVAPAAVFGIGVQSYAPKFRFKPGGKMQGETY
jgi:hypothetical protein